MHSGTMHLCETSVFCLPEAAGPLLEPVFFFHLLLSMLLPATQMNTYRQDLWGVRGDWLLKPALDLAVKS